MIRFSGALGPLQAAGLTGSLTVKFCAVPGGSNVELSYVVGGFMPGGFEKIAPAVDSVLAEQLRRFRNFAETGDPVKSRAKGLPLRLENRRELEPVNPE